MSLLEMKSQVFQILEERYPTNLEESAAAAPGEGAGVDVLTCDLTIEPDWDLADLTGGAHLGSRASICGHYGRLREAW